MRGRVRHVRFEQPNREIVLGCTRIVRPCAIFTIDEWIGQLRSDRANYTLRAQVFLATPETAAGLHLDGGFGNAEFAGNVLLRHSAKFSKYDDFTTSSGQRLDCLEQHFDLFVRAGRITDTLPIFNDRRPRKFSNVFDRRSEFMAYRVERQVTRDFEKKALRRRDRPGHLPSPHPQIRFLHHVIDPTHRRKGSAEVISQGRVVRPHFLLKPPARLELRRSEGADRMGRRSR